MNARTKTTIKVVMLVLFLALSVGLEFEYRKPLFDKSLEWIAEWQSEKTQSTINFFKFITNLGQGAALIPLLIIIILWFPLNKSYAFLMIVIYSYHVDNVMKMMYGNPRPFWEKPSLFISCNGGYGNPSGHAFSSMSVFPAFAHVISDFQFFKKSNLGIILRIFIFLFFIGLAITILLSRIYLAAHSVNQVLYGSCLGLMLYYIVFIIFEVHTWTGKNLFDFFKNKKYIIAFGIWYTFLFLNAFLIWGLVENEDHIYQNYLNTVCPSLNPYRMLTADGLFGTLSLFGLVGGHYGLTLLAYLTENRYANKEEEINHWYKGGFLFNIYKILIGALFGLPLLLIFIISGNASLTVIYIFKVSIPYLIGLFNIFGPFIYVFIRLKLANSEIFTSNENKNQGVEIIAENINIRDLSKSNNVMIGSSQSHQEV